MFAALLTAAAASAPFLLRPQTSASREAISLDGIWHVKADPSDIGHSEGWAKALPLPTLAAPVPSTLNQLLAIDGAANFSDGYFGAVWYQRDFYVSADWARNPNFTAALRVDAATANAELFLNGVSLSSHRGVGLPFGGAAELLSPQTNRITVRVDGRRTWSDLPPGNQVLSPFGRPMLLGGDAGYYYSIPGVDGSVWLTRAPAARALTDVSWVFRPPGTLSFNVSCGAAGSCGEHVAVSLLDTDAGPMPLAEVTGKESGELALEQPKLWWPVGLADPRKGRPLAFLYELRVRTDTDEYRLRVGLREVSTSGRELRINGQRVYLKGADHHIDSPIRGHGDDAVMNARDVALMRWLGMNAVRVTSWAAPESMLDLLDEGGIMMQARNGGTCL